MSKSRKRIFPKPPVKFHSKLAHELGKWSNKNGYEASCKAIYFQELKPKVGITESQAKHLIKLKEALARRANGKVDNSPRSQELTRED